MKNIITKVTASALVAMNLTACQASEISNQEDLMVLAQSNASKTNFTTNSPTFYENRLKSFVYNWFSLFDSNAPHEEFYKRLVKTNNLEFRFPDATLRSQDDFKKWYDGILKNIKIASHQLKDIQIKKQSDHKFIINVDVLWTGVPYQGKSIIFNAHQEWHVQVMDSKFEDIRIEKYLVSENKSRI